MSSKTDNSGSRRRCKARGRCPHIIFVVPDDPAWRGVCWACGTPLRLNARGEVVEEAGARS